MKKPAFRRAAEKPALYPRTRRPMKIEHEYKRLGAWAYLAALDVHRAKLFGRCESKTGIAAFDRLVDQVMKQRPTARLEEFSGSSTTALRIEGSPRPQASGRSIPTGVVHGPIHASWLNQIEIYFSIVQRKS